jgi:hypothetical protein
MSRPLISHVLEKGGQETPQGLAAALHNWKGVHAKLSQLLATANPNAVAAGDLNLAFLQPDRPESRVVMERYRTRYGSMIAEHLRPTFDTVHQIDQEVERLLDFVTQGESQATLPRSNILELCGRLAEQLSDLKDLASLGESDG